MVFHENPWGGGGSFCGIRPLYFSCCWGKIWHPSRRGLTRGGTLISQERSLPMTRQEQENLVEYTLNIGRQMMECGAEA